MRHRYVLAAVAVGALAVAAVPIGRMESTRFEESQNEGLTRVWRAVGRLYQPSLAHYRYQRGMTCLVYRRRTNELALEVCFDGHGRLLEAVDRRSGHAERWSLLPRPERARIRIDAAAVERARSRLVAEELAKAKRRLRATRGS